MLFAQVKDAIARRVAPFALMALLAMGACTLAACSAGEEAPQAPSASMTVQVDVVSEVSDPFYSGAVELPEGATALDALEATGLEYVVEDSQYGAFVSSVNGLANGETSATAGWMYELNGEVALESCDELTLSDGDSLTWEYSEFE